MNLIEFEGKQLLRAHGIETPRGRLARTPAEASAIAAELGGPCVIKAQVAAGGRGKSGLVQFAATPDEAGRAAARVLGQTGGSEIDLLLVEERLDIASEFYLAIRVDDVLGAPRLLVSCHGGVDVESHAGELQSMPIDVRTGLRRHEAVALWKRAGLQGSRLQAATQAAVCLWKAFDANDAELMEINPLVFDVRGRCWAADAKATIDDSALRRHPELARHAGSRGMSLLERRAARLGVNSLVELDGNVAIISTGASFGMLVLDKLDDLGARPANFMDMGGQSSVLARELIVQLMATHVAATPAIKAVLIALIQTSKPIMNLVSAIRAGFAGRMPACPVYCWIGAAHVATQECPLPQALASLEEIGVHTFARLDDALQACAKAGRS